MLLTEITPLVHVARGLGGGAAVGLGWELVMAELGGSFSPSPVHPVMATTPKTTASSVAVRRQWRITSCIVLIGPCLLR